MHSDYSTNQTKLGKKYETLELVISVRILGKNFIGAVLVPALFAKEEFFEFGLLCKNVL